MIDERRSPSGRLRCSRLSLITSSTTIKRSITIASSCQLPTAAQVNLDCTVTQLRHSGFATCLPHPQSIWPSISFSLRSSFFTPWRDLTQISPMAPATTSVEVRRHPAFSRAAMLPSVTNHVARAVICAFHRTLATTVNVRRPSNMSPPS